MANVEDRFQSSKAQGLLNEYGEFLKEVMNEIIAEYNAPIAEKDPMLCGIEYQRRLEGKNSLRKMLQRINSIAGK